MKTLYFSANLNGLVECLKQYSLEEDVYRFINALDFLNKHMKDKYLIPSSTEIIMNCLKYINSFLIKVCLRKNILDNSENQISLEELANSLSPILTLLPTKVKSKNKTYDVGDDNCVTNAIASVMSEYELSEDKKTIQR